MNLHNKKNKLKDYRTRYSIPLVDSAFILDTDVGNLSKYENGELSPTLKIAIAYHLLYGMPMQALIDNDFMLLKSALIDRLFMLSEQLMKKKQTDSVTRRIESINGMITRLNTEEQHED
ncbi:hypothetical protein L0P88_13635 [Muricauda sp. SCSIO 64092]|uniref:hypothetical protein n=1 Tax=Allomuricauda sp. SCSIO 64092 TaxID=2908842 RepID=UPI001FF149C0|nr:hypothetical protein [Muricauda sp. SCSIO 64092]UOY04993.1 hypothetical protein L0P88_13635 [Muricauda sp. SCSIO 64092]